MISLITMTQGNPIAIKRTLDSFKEVCDEVILGDVCIFEEDRQLIMSYEKEYNLKIIKLPFNFIYKFGFSSILNILSFHAKNKMVMYMNVGELIDGEHRIKELIQHFNQFNTYPFDHATDPHSWFRCYNKDELKWDGMIHEELIGEARQAPFYIFRMKDSPKDTYNTFKAKVMDDIKELCYFNQYIKLVEKPELKGTTNDYWVKFANENYDSLKERMRKKGIRVNAFDIGDLSMYLNDVYSNPDFEKERFESSELIDFQLNKKTLL